MIVQNYYFSPVFLLSYNQNIFRFISLDSIQFESVQSNPDS